MEAIDPATGQQLPADAIQRILYIANKVHVYNIPPLASTKGYTAATWTEDPKRHIFSVRLRILETAIPQPGGEDKVKADVVLEDPANGQLFAAAPYIAAAVVEPALDSSRFFAIRVQDEAGRKATLGIGFEERSEAFDFGVALQEAQKSIGLVQGAGAGLSGGKADAKPKLEEKRDYSLKEGETITVNLGGKFSRRARPQAPQSEAAPANLSSFALPPPPTPPPSASSSNRNSWLPPPPSASDFRSQKQPATGAQEKSAKELGFDDGQFGEFA